MSFILDALRKSEHERQRQAGPTIAEMPVIRPPATRVPATGIAVGALVLVNVAVLAYFLLRNPQPATEPAPTAAASAAATASTPAQPAPAAPVAAPPATRDVRPLAGEASPSFDQPPPAQYGPPAPPDPSLLPPVRAAVPAPPAAARSGTDDEFLPTIDDLAPRATAGLPQLNLDLHVYATDAAHRFVFVNGQRYTEGAATPDGVKVERITRDGVILNWHGNRFLLRRQ